MTTRLYFAGGEAPTARRRLVEAGATRIAVNFTTLAKRGDDMRVSQSFPDEVGVLAMASAGEYEEHDDEGWLDFHDLYLDFVGKNLNRLDVAIEFSPPWWDLDTIKQFRENFWMTLPPEKWAPVWHPEESLEELCEVYDRIGIPAAAVEQIDDLPDMLMVLRSHYETRFVVFGGATEDLLGNDLVTAAWTAPQRWGEVLVFDGRLRRTKGEVTEYTAAINALKCDVEKVENRDPEEMATLAIRSLLVWASDGVADTVANPLPRELAHREDSAPATPPESRWVTPTDGRKALPVLGMLQTGDDPVEARTTDEQIRVCDRCPLRTLCPEFVSGNGCAYALPVELRTKGQLRAMVNSLLEIQAKRVMMSRFEEELKGGLPMEETGEELERFFAMAERGGKVLDDRNFFRMEIETSGDGGGILSQFFGANTGARAAELEQPISGNRVIDVITDND